MTDILDRLEEEVKNDIANIEVRLKDMHTKSQMSWQDGRIYYAKTILKRIAELRE